MIRIHRCLLPVCALLALLAVHATPAGAAVSRYIRSTGTSIGPGVASITIESFGLGTAPGPSLALLPSYTSNVAIPAASSETNTAILIRDALNIDLPSEYVAAIPAGSPHFVQVTRSTGTFTVSIVENVPGQVIEEYVIPVPFLDARAALLLGMMMLGAGGWWLHRTRRQAMARG